MNYNIQITRNELNELFIGAKDSFPAEMKDRIFDDNVFNKECLTINELLELSNKANNAYDASLIKRMIAAKIILDSQKSDEKIEIGYVWRLIYDSLINLNESDIVSSIGSQGFLSIPLFRLDKGNESFDFLRLHIWSNILDQYIDFEKVKTFAMHSHQFHANSWVLAGEVFNTRIDILPSDIPTDYCLFKIEWNDSENEVNKKTSIAINTGKYVLIHKNEKESYHFGDQYQIEAGKYHLSRTNRDFQITATLFLFSTHRSRVQISNVVGPASIKSSEINRKVIINPKPALILLNKLLNHE